LIHKLYIREEEVVEKHLWNIPQTPALIWQLDHTASEPDQPTSVCSTPYTNYMSSITVQWNRYFLSSNTTMFGKGQTETKCTSYKLR